MKLLVVIILLQIVLIGLAVYPLTISKTDQNVVDEKELKELAITLRSKELYSQAIQVLREYLTSSKLPPEKRANIYFTLGDIYRENLHDYSSAMAEYLRVKQLIPTGELQQEANKHIVTCLERLQRSKDAQRELDKVTRANAEQKTEANPESVVAHVGERSVTIAELKTYFDRLPESIQEKYKDKEGITRFVREYIAQDLMYSAAKRAAYDQDPKIVEDTFQAQKALMVEKFYMDQVQKEIKIEPSDLKLYYDAHKDMFKKKVKNPNTNTEETVPASFEEAIKEVERALLMEKEQGKYLELMERMLSAEKVQIDEERLPDRF